MDLGIVGLPNVGKSTLFNALTEMEVPSENYPFCTVDPNVGVVPVPDPRLDYLSEVVETETVTPARVEFTDIAGLVENAHEGEGLGNKFLGHIRSCDAICHVLRLFSASDVTHIRGRIDPLEDIDVLEAEFALADLGVLEDPLAEAEKATRIDGDEARQRYNLLKTLEEKLSEGTHVDPNDFDEKEQQWLKELPLLSNKPVLYVLNVDESLLDEPEQSGIYRETTDYIEKETTSEYVTLSAEFEVQLIGMEADERELFMADYGLVDSGLNRLVRKAHELLDLITFFTYNENELRAWSMERGSTALRAAGKIHSDFREDFIRAEVVNFEEFKNYNSWNEAKGDGAVRSRGEDYVVKDGDILQVLA